MNRYDNLEKYRNRERFNRNNYNPSLGYSRGLPGFGCSILFFIVAFVFSLSDIFDAETTEQGLEILRIIIFLTFLVFIYNLVEYRFYKNNLITKQNGVRVNGFISDIKIKVKSYEDDIKLKYRLIVDYTDPFSGKLINYKTPELNFDPFDDLGSRECSVYIYKGHVFVTDFVKKVNSEIVFFVEDYPQLHPANVKRQHYMNRILKFIVPIAVSLALVYLISWLIH